MPHSVGWRSLSRRLPLLISALLIGTIALFSLIAYRQLTKVLMSASALRMERAASRVGSAFEDAGRRLHSEIERLAADSMVIRYTVTRDGRSQASAEAALKRAATASPQSLGIEVNDRLGRRLLWVDGAGTKNAAFLRNRRDNTALPRQTTIGPMVSDHGILYFTLVAPIVTASHDTLGFVQQHGQISSSDASQLIGGLIGKDASVLLGNADRKLWTNLSSVVPNPPVGSADGSAVVYKSHSGAQRVGAGVPIKLTPWLVWVDLPISDVLAPANRFLRDIALAGLLLALIGGLVALLISREITTPLRAITLAAKGIAAGDYSRRVNSSRQDELGAMAKTFDVMAQQVDDSRHGLEDRVEERSRELNAALAELRDAQESLVRRESEERLQRIFDHISDALFIADDTGRILDANPAACELTGHTVEELRSIPLGEVLPESAKPVETTGVERQSLASLTAADRAVGSPGTRVVDVQAAAFAPGTLVYTVRDLTKQRKLEEQLAQSQKMDAVGQLAGGVAHDFNNLLTVIMSYSLLLLESMESADPRHGDVQEISAAAERAAGLTRQLLAFSRKQVMQSRAISVNSVVGGVEKMLGRMIGEDIELATTLEPHLALINADPGQLEQVIINLAVNARDAMPNGGRLHITTANTDLSREHSDRHLDATPGPYVMLAVSDTGMGMTREVQLRAFEPFFTTKDQGKGTGLGLSTVYGIVKQSGGDVWVYSEPGQGTTFKVYFPMLDARELVASSTVESSSVKYGSETILVVEDDAALRSLTARILEASGYTVLLAENGLEALALATRYQGNIDMLATDVIMPVMSGRPLVEKLSQTRPEMKVLFMSGYTDDEIMRRGVLDGRTAFLQKPFTPMQFANKVRAVLDDSNTGVAAPSPVEPATTYLKSA